MADEGNWMMLGSSVLFERMIDGLDAGARQKLERDSRHVI
jgi:hypothetical protein